MGVLTSVRRTLYVPAVALFILSLAPAARAQYVGYVFEIGGDWQLGGRNPQKLSKGYQLPASGVVSIESPESSDHILILDNRGIILARRRCSIPGECSRPIALPGANRARPSSAEVMFDSVMKLLWGEPEIYILTRSRGIELADAVARLDGGKLDLGPVLKNLEAGGYNLRMREVAGDEKGTRGEWLKPFELKWEPSDPAAAVVPAAGLRPGLYEVAAFNRSNGVYIPTGQSARVLVSEGAAFEKAAAAQREALALAAKWGDAVTPEVARGFLLAHLSYLSRQAVK